MSGKISGLVWDMALPMAQKYVLLAMADHADHEGYGVRPSYDLLAWKTGYTKRHVMTIVAQLEALKILVLDKPGGTAANPFECNSWHIDVKPAPQTPPRKFKKEEGVIPRSPGGGDPQITRSVNTIEPNTISSGVPKDITPPTSEPTTPPTLAQPPLIETPAAPPKTPKPRKPRATAPANPDRSKIYNAIGMLYYGVDPVKDPAAFKPFGAMTNKLTTTFLKAHPFTYDEFIECSKTFPQGYRDWLKAETNIGETVGKWLKEKQRQAAITARASMVIRARNPLNDTIAHYRDGKPIFVEIDGKVIPCNERGEPLKETSI